MVEFSATQQKKMIRNSILIFCLSFFIVDHGSKYLVSLHSCLLSHNKQITSWFIRLYDFYYLIRTRCEESVNFDSVDGRAPH